MNSKKKTCLIQKTPRLVLRPLQTQDYEKWCEAYSQMLPPQNLWDETNWKASALTKSEFKKLLSNQKKSRNLDKDYHFGIFLKQEGRLIGTLNCSDISRGIFQNAYIGYRVFNPYWGNKFAQEAVSGLLQLSFRKLRLHRLEAAIQSENRASIKVAKAVGMKKECVSRKRLYFMGQWIDLNLFVATSEDFGIQFKFPNKAYR